MATQQLNLIADSSTYANYWQWAAPIDQWFATNSWVQSTDTGQWMRSGLTISAVSGISGSSANYTYTLVSGAALQVGQALTITALTHSINNGTFVITALGAGYFTIVNQNGTPLAESGSSGVVTAASTVPGSGAFYYSIWQPTDGMSNFYAKVEYGNDSGQTNSPSIRITISTSTNGAGVASGVVMGPYRTQANGASPPSSSITYDCRFSARPGQISVLMWRGSASLGSNGLPQAFAIERSIIPSGGTYAYTGTHVTMMLNGSGNSSVQGYVQQTLVFGVGVAPLVSNNNGITTGGIPCRYFWLGNGGANPLFQNMVPMDTASPFVGQFDYPLTSFGVLPQYIGVEGATFSINLYGASHTYIETASGLLGRSTPNNYQVYFCMRYE